MRHPANVVASVLLLPLLSVLVLVGCHTPSNQGPPGPLGTPGNPGNPGDPGDPGRQGFQAEGTPRSPVVHNGSPEAAIMVSSGVMSVDEPLTIAGSGFLPGEPVTLVLVVDDIVSFVIGGRTAEQPTANAAGAFAVSFESISGEGRGARGALERAPGIRTIRAEGEDGSRASAPVMSLA